MSGRIAVLGGGAWGTALACVARRRGTEVALFARDPETADAVGRGENPKRLPGVALPPGIEGTTDIDAAIRGADAILAAVPAQSMRATLESVDPSLLDGMPVAICAKGIERGALKRMAQVVAEVAPRAVPVVLTGPTFAREVAAGLPTAVVLACHRSEAVAVLRGALGGDCLRFYESDDLIGAEVGGAVKNVIALAAGICTGRGLGENARAALVSRGLAETIRLAVALGGRAETVMGLSGSGDLILTAMSATSRNTAFGMKIGEGGAPLDVLLESAAVTEGYWSAAAVEDLADQVGVEMPICEAVAAVLRGEIDVDGAVATLFERPSGAEFRDT
jgi:glycerol-3-phosphate dehydrogenase (NAD(P)+)